MALKIDAKFERKLDCAFKNDTRNLVNFIRLINGDFTLESKMAELNKIKIQNNQIDQMQCENFILSWKQIKSTTNKNLCTCSAESLFLMN